MRLYGSRVYHLLVIASNYFSLNFLWLVACLPLITIMPATAALFAIARDWARGQETGLVTPFLDYMRENFVQSILVGFLWTIAGAVLVTDFLFIREITSMARIPMSILFIALTLVYFMTAVYLFPVMVHFKSGWLQVIKNSFFIAMFRPGTTLLCLTIVGLSILAFYLIPFTILASGSITAYLVFRLCLKVFQQTEELIKKTDE